MKPVKKLSILFCLGVVFASAAGYWFFAGHTPQNYENPGGADQTNQDKIADEDSQDQHAFSDPLTFQNEQPTEPESESAKQAVPQKRNSESSKFDSFSKRRSAAEATTVETPIVQTSKAEIFEDKTELTQSIVESAPQSKSPDAAPSFARLEEPSSVESSPVPEDFVAREEHPKTVWLSLGAGVSFSSLTQDVPGSSDLKAGKISAPFLFLELGAWLSKVFGFEFGYQSLPGKVLNSPSLAVSKEDYTWKTMSAEVNYRVNYLGLDSEWILKVGLQQQEIPFLYPQSASAISLFENSMTTASTGIQHRRRLGPQTYFEGLVRYQHPVHTTSVANSNIDVKSPLILDGEVGATYNLKENLSVGGFWSVQYLSYRYRFSESSSSPAQNGKQTLMQSNLNLRLRWEF